MVGMGLSGRTMKRVATLFNNEEYERLAKVEPERVELERVAAMRTNRLLQMMETGSSRTVVTFREFMERRP